MQKVLYLFKEGDFHIGKQGGELLAKYLQDKGEFELVATSDLDELLALSTGKYALVAVYTTGLHDDLAGERETALLDFVEQGGGYVAIHSAADSFRGSRKYVEMLNGEFKTHPHHHTFPISIINNEHYITCRVPSFEVYDEMYHLQSFDPQRCTVLAETIYQGEHIPMVFVRNHGAGRVVYLANGHTQEAFEHEEFSKMLVRAIEWAAGAEKPTRTIGCGLLGYGPAFNMGKGHAGWINDTPGMRTVAMCDANPARVEAAQEELPGLLGYYTDVDEMLALPELDLVVVILPHYLHAPMALKCLRAGKSVITEKPFCITVAEANEMIEAAQAKNLTLSVFHNRRWDGDYLTIKEIVKRGLIGDIFHIECGQGNFGRPGTWWRSDKAISGGIMYDWGAHFWDWILNLAPGKITQVWGDFQKRVWHHVTNADHGEAIVRFDSGVTASYMTSQIAGSMRPKWRILGTKGSITMTERDVIDVVSLVSGIRQDSKVTVSLPGYGSTQYYRNIADHMLRDEPLIITPESARRVIAVIEAAAASSREGVSVPIAPGCE